MQKTGLLPKKICINEEIDIIKISMKNDDNKLNNILCVFRDNLEHLEFWTRPSNELLFNTIDDIKRHYKNTTCYAILYDNKIIGCIDISKVKIDENKLHFRSISYWIDKNYLRKGIMFKCLKSLEELFMDHGLDYLCDYVEEINIPSVKLLEKLGYKAFVIYGWPSFIVDEETGKSWDILLFKKYFNKEKK